MQKVEMARKIADAAGMIDFLKNSPVISDETREEARQQAETLHDIATELAGDQLHEVYGKDETDDELQKIRAAGQCTVCEIGHA